MEEGVTEEAQQWDRREPAPCLQPSGELEKFVRGWCGQLAFSTHNPSHSNEAIAMHI